MQKLWTYRKNTVCRIGDDIQMKCKFCGEEIYTAFEEGKLGSCIICENCAKGNSNERSNNV